MAGAGCPSPHARPLPGGTCCLLTWKMSAGGRSGVATAGNGPSTSTDPPASSPGQLSAPLRPTPQVQYCPAPVPMASFTVLVPVPSTGTAPRFSTGVQKCPPGKAKQENVSMSGTGAQPCTRHSVKPQRRLRHNQDGYQSAGTRTQEPQHSHQWPVGGPLPSTDSPAGHNLLLHIPTVLSHCTGTATLSWAAPSQAALSRAALQTAPKTWQHNPMPQTQLECGDLSSSIAQCGRSSSSSWGGQSSQAYMPLQVFSCLEELLQRYTVVTPSPAHPAPFCWHWTSTGPAPLCHPPGSALRRGSLLSTDQLPHFSLLSF